MNRDTHPRAMRGFSLIEILLVVGIISVLVIAAFVIYPKVSDASKVRKEITALQSTVTGVRSLFRGKTTYGFDHHMGKRAGVVPSDWNTPIGQLPSNGFGGTVSYNAALLPSTPGGYNWSCSSGNMRYCRSLRLGYYTPSISKGACMDLLKGLSSMIDSGLIYSIEPGGPAPLLEQGDITPDVIASACDGMRTSTSNSHVLIFLGAL